MSKYLSFTTDDKDKTGCGFPCIVERKIAKALKIAVANIDIRDKHGTIKRKKSWTWVELPGGTQELVKRYDRGQPLKPGKYLVKLS